MAEVLSSSRSLRPLERFLLLIIPVIAWNFYNYVGFNQQITKLVGFVVSLILLLFYVMTFRKDYLQRGTYSRYLSLYLLVVLLSFINALLYWGQSPILTFRASSFLFFLIYYFILKRIKPSYQEIVIIIYFFAITYCILWLIAFLAAPSVVFGNLENLDDNRGMFRVLQLHSFDFVCLLFFYLIVNRTKRNFLSIVLAIICFLITIFTLSRMFIGAMVLVAGAYLLRKKTFFLVIFIAAVLLIPSKYTFDSEIAQNLFQLTESQMEDSKGDAFLVRSEYRDFGKLYDFHIPTFLFGNGIAHVESNYGRIEESYKDQYSFNRSDAGYVGQYVSFGLFGLLCLLLILWNVVRQKVPDNYLYLKLFIYYLFIVSLTSNSFSEFMIAFVIVLYLLDELKSRPKSLEF